MKLSRRQLIKMILKETKDMQKSDTTTKSKSTPNIKKGSSNQNYYDTLSKEAEDLWEKEEISTEMYELIGGLIEWIDSKK